MQGKNVIIFGTVNNMKKSIAIVFLVLVLVGSSTYMLSSTAQASNGFPQAQYQTPTPDANGRIVYTVQAGDTCLRISLLTKVSLDSIRALNNLDSNCSIFSGQQLLLAVVTATPMLPTSEFTDTPAGPTPTPFHGNGQICIVLFNDADGNGRKGDTEEIIPDGNISISDQTGSVSLTGKTLAGTEPVCFINIPEGDYNISIAVPSGYNPTTSLNYPLTLKAGDMATVGFGAQSKEPPPPASGGLLLAIIGTVLVVLGIGLGVYLWRSGKLH
jgi:LysM repeat protein